LYYKIILIYVCVVDSLIITEEGKKEEIKTWSEKSACDF
jgi:hypothetical protein